MSGVRLMDWARILAFVTGTVDQELLARIEYLAAENRILKAQLKGRLQLSDAERATLGEIGHRLGRNVLAEVATVARPDTILAWYRKLVARKFDGSKARRSPGRPRVKRAVEQLIVRMAKENGDWGYDRIVGALANLGYKVCDQTVGNVLQRHGLPPAPERKRTTTWSAFIRAHLALLAGTDFFTAEVLTLHGLVTYYVLFFIHLESRRVDIAGITVRPGRAVDEANGPERDHGRMRRAARLPLSASRSRQQVHPVVPGDHCIRPSRTARVAGVQSEPECLCGALG
jgi:putative transposase